MKLRIALLALMVCAAGIALFTGVSVLIDLEIVHTAFD